MSGARPDHRPPTARALRRVTLTTTRSSPTKSPVSQRVHEVGAAAGLKMVRFGSEDWARGGIARWRGYAVGSARGVPTRLARYDGPLILMTTAPSTRRSSHRRAQGPLPK